MWTGNSRKNHSLGLENGDSFFSWGGSGGGGLAINKKG